MGTAGEDAGAPRGDKQRELAARGRDQGVDLAHTVSDWYFHRKPPPRMTKRRRQRGKQVHIGEQWYPSLSQWPWRTPAKA